MTASRPSGKAKQDDARRALVELSVPSELGNERLAMERVAEATMNAMEHGNRYRPEVPVKIQVLASDVDLLVRITDQGGSPVPLPDKEVPDLEAKLEGLQSPRGWGLFLIQSMVDEVRVSGNPNHHTVELVMHLEGGAGAS